MYKKKNILAIIPARGGSKSIPGKNIVPLLGKPLIGYTIRQAKQARLIDRTVVSSDSTAILALASRMEVEIIRRPGKLSRDKSKMDEALWHALVYLQKKDNYVPDLVVVLQPTSPLRRVQTIDRAIVAFVDKVNQFDSLTAVGPLEPKVGYVKNGCYKSLNSINMQRQELKPMYKECGTIFVFKSSRILKKQTLYGQRIMPFIIDSRKESLDINDKQDLELASYFLKYE